jgi:hypothetical protein
MTYMTYLAGVALSAPVHVWRPLGLARFFGVVAAAFPVLWLVERQGAWAARQLRRGAMNSGDA